VDSSLNPTGRWLAALGLGQYAAAFASQGIEFDLLPELSDADLERCGVAMLGHRKRLLKAIAAFREAATDDATPRAPAPAAAAAALAPGSAAVQRTEAERRQLTVMFCDLVGATALSTQRDPEDLRGILSAYHRIVKDAVAPYDGYIAQLLGDGMLVFFGYPRAHEDEAIRAVRASLEAIRAVGQHEFGPGLRLQARVGIATGLVVIGGIGAGTPAAETGVSGEAPNLAARLQGAAPAMGIVIADATRHQIGSAFRLESLGTLTLKGFAQPQTAWRVLDERTAGTRFEAMRVRSSSRLAGRDAELALLMDRWALAGAGEAEAVLLSGEAGMGKSRIAQALRDQIEQLGGLVLTFQCSPSHAGSPLYPVMRWLDVSADLTPEDTGPAKLSKIGAALLALGIELQEADRQWIAALLSPTELAPDLARLPPAEMQRGVQTVLTAMLARLSRVRPLLWLVEDAHWIDAATDELLARVIQVLRDAPLLTLVTARPSYQPSWASRASVTRLTLNRLGRRACEQIVTDIAVKQLPAALLGQILAKTDGVPLFVEEFTQTVLQSGQVAEVGPVWQLTGPLQNLSVPSTLHDSLMARLDQLSLAREVALVGAAMGREFDAQVVAHVLQLDAARLQAPLAELEQAALVVHGGNPLADVYTFKHALMRDVAYESMLRTVRAGIHGRIARALSALRPETAETMPELLALHFQQAGEEAAAWPMWLKAAEAAGRKAIAFEQSLEFCDRALQLLGNQRPASLAQLCDTLLLKESVLARLGRLADQMSTIDEALAIAEALGEPMRVASVLLRRASVCAYLGHTEQARLAGTRALDTYRQLGDRPGEAQALRELGFLYWRTEEYGTALLHAREALASHRNMGDVAGEATALHNLAEIHRGLGSPQQALDWYEQALQLHWAVGDRQGEILTLFGIANALRQAGDLSASKRKYEEALALSQRYGERTMQSRALQALSIDARAQGALEDALAFMRRAIDIDRSIGYAHALSHDLVELGAIHLLRRERDEAYVAIREARAWFEVIDDAQGFAATGRWLEDFDAGRTPSLKASEQPRWVKTHVPLPEGKVYCEFESPLAASRQA
jgi:class 3 adenylate cyclase/tetratricopeptide (TPR) repeat protein